MDEDRLEYELYFKKLIGNQIVDVPFTYESTGTQKLLDIFPFLFSSILGSSVFLDEIDSGIHDLLMANILEQLNGDIKGQFIATTHNTMLMERLPQDSVYIIVSDANGDKDIVCVSDYKFRTQKNNNIRSKYLRGDYEGVPFVGYLSFKDLVDDTMKSIQPDKDGDTNKNSGDEEGD